MPHIYLFIYLGIYVAFQHCTGYITTGSWKGRGNQYIQFVRVLYCKQPTNGKQLPAFPLETVPGTKPRPQRWEARVVPLCHCGLCATHICILYILRHSYTYHIQTLNKFMIKLGDRIYNLLNILSVPFLDCQRCLTGGALRNLI